MCKKTFIAMQPLAFVFFLKKITKNLKLKF